LIILNVLNSINGPGERYINEGPDFSFQPLDEYDVLHKPSLKILGTRKRIGKTAVSAYAARLIHRKNTIPVCGYGREVLKNQKSSGATR
jgi:predicted GTPase